MVYVDGFNLYFGLREKQWSRYYWLDLVKLAQNMLKDGQKLVGVEYFTARVSTTKYKPNKAKRQKIYLEALGTLPRLSITYGHYNLKPSECLKCGARWKRPEEKMTDVNIACVLLDDAYKDRYDRAIVISGDSDLVPPLRTIKANFPKKRLLAAFPPERHSKHLRETCHNVFSLGRGIIEKSQLPDEITKPDGYILKRPEHWKK